MLATHRYIRSKLLTNAVRSKLNVRRLFYRRAKNGLREEINNNYNEPYEEHCNVSPDNFQPKKACKRIKEL